VEETLNRVPNREPRTVAEVLDIDRESREVARDIANRKAAGAPTGAVRA
jgi:hypothetical protein